MRTTLPLLRATVALLTLAAADLAAQTRPDSATYVVRIGRDTSLVQWVVRDGNRVRTHLVRRIPAVEVRRSEVTLAHDGSVERVDEIALDPAAGSAAPPTDRVVVHRRGDSTVIEYGLGAAPRRVTFAGGAQIINGPFFFSAYPVVATHRRLAVGDSAVGQHFPGPGLGVRRLVIRRAAPDTVTLYSSVMGQMRVTLDRAGAPSGFDGTGSSINYQGVRVPWLDADSVARAFVRQQEAAGAAGALSPRDSTVTTVGGAVITLDYGRPSKRGRPVFGGIVPYDRVWRTGANRATHLSTSRPLAFGDVQVPAGQYTLWTLPTRQGWTLVINRQTGQWGTEYDARHDLARIPMAVRAVAEQVEQLTVAAEPAGASRGVLRVRWDTVEATAPFGVRQ